MFGKLQSRRSRNSRLTRFNSSCLAKSLIVEALEDRTLLAAGLLPKEFPALDNNGPSALRNVDGWEQPAGVESEQNNRDLRSRANDTPSAMNTVSLHEVSTDVFIERHGVMLSLDELGSDLRGGPTQLNGNGLEFQFNAAPGTPQEVIDGFAEAGLLWSQAFFDDILVSVNISFPELGPGILGSTFAAETFVSYFAFQTQIAADALSADDATAVANLQPGADFGMLINRTADNPNGAGSATPYVDDNADANNTTINLTTANAKAIGGLGIAPGNMGIDADIAFSSLFAWDFDPSDGISAGAFDFVGVAAHEIGHALGFISGVDILDFNSPPLNGPFNSDLFTFVSPLDMYRYSTDSVAAVGGPFIDWTADARTKSFSIDGGSTFLTTFSQGSFFGDGNQASHWKDNLGIGIMDPTFAPGELGVISAFDIQAFDVIGWDAVPPPPNDDFADRRDLGSTTSLTTAGNNDGYTGETGEPAQSGTITSAWWSWTAPASGELVVDTNGSDFDTFLTLATGSAVDALTVLDQDDNGGSGLQSLITASVTAGMQYQIAVDGFEADTGAITLNVSFTFPNDDFANRIDLGSAESVTTPGNNVGFTGEPGEPPQSDPIQSAWWSWTAPDSGTLIVDTNGSDFDTFLTLATGTAVDALTVLDQNDDFGFSLQSQIVARVTAGVQYQIAVDGFSDDTGDIVLNVSFLLPPPNDDFADRIDLGSVDSVTTVGSNSGATGEPGEPPQSGLINSAWWSWTAPASGQLIVDTNGSNFDTFLTLATGSAVDALTVLGQDDDGGNGLQSQIIANVTAGTQYQFAVDGFASDMGDISLNLTFIGFSFVDADNDGLFTAGTDVALVAGEVDDGVFDARRAEGGYTVVIPGAGLVLGGAAITVGGDLKYRADGDLTVYTDLTAGDDISLVSRSGSVLLIARPTITAVDEIEIDAALDIRNTTSTGLFSVLFVIEPVNIQATGADSEVELTAGRDIFVGGAAISAGDDVELTAGRDIAAASSFITALGNAEGEIEMEAGGQIFAWFATLLAGEEIELTGGGIDMLGSTMQALAGSEGEIELQAAFFIFVDEAMLTAGEEIELTATAGFIVADFAVIEALGSSDGEIELHAAGEGISVVAATLRANEEIELTATGGSIIADFAVMEALGSSDGEIELKAAGEGISVIAATLLANEEIELTATGGGIIADFAVMEALGSSDGEIELKAAGLGISLFAATLLANEEIELTATGGIIFAPFAVMEALGSSDGEIELEAAGDIIVFGATLRAGEDVELTTHGGSIDAGAAQVFAGGDIEMRASAGNIFGQNGTYTSDNGDIEMTAAVDVDVQNATITAFDDVDLRAGNDLFVQSALITAGDDIVLTAGDEVFVQDAVLNAGDRVVINGIQVGTPA